MLFAQKLILNVPPVLLGTIIVLSAVILSVAGLLIMRRFIPHQKLKLHNDVAGFMFGTLGVIYAVLLAFTVIIVWETFDNASSIVEKEASFLADLYRDAEAFQEPFRKEVNNLFLEYGKAIVTDEWKTMSRGEKSRLVQEIQDKIWTHYTSYLPKNLTEEVFFRESVDKLNELCELRRQRLMESLNGVDTILWFVLIVSGIITIVFTFFFGTENLRAQIIMTSLLAIVISLILFTILEFDYPFTGNLSVSPEPFKHLRLLNGVNWNQLK